MKEGHVDRYFTKKLIINCMFSLEIILWWSLNLLIFRKITWSLCTIQIRGEVREWDKLNKKDRLGWWPLFRNVKKIELLLEAKVAWTATCMIRGMARQPRVWSRTTWLMKIIPKKMNPFSLICFLIKMPRSWVQKNKLKIKIFSLRNKTCAKRVLSLHLN